MGSLGKGKNAKAFMERTWNRLLNEMRGRSGVTEELESPSHLSLGFGKDAKALLFSLFVNLMTFLKKKISPIFILAFVFSLMAKDTLKKTSF